MSHPRRIARLSFWFIDRKCCHALATLALCDAEVVAEELLAGGVMNAGVVVRDGAHVLRPSSPHSSTIFGFLEAIRSAGFDGVPQPAGFTDDGRERLVYIAGEVALPPFPDWAQTDDALVSAAMLIRRFHEASARI